MKKSIVFVLVLTLLLSVVIMPQSVAFAKTRNWYGKYCEYKGTAKKAVSIKGNKVYLKGKWENSSSRYGTAKVKKIKKTFKLTKKTKYYLETEDSDKAKKISKKKFKKNMHSDLVFITFKVKKGKVVKAIVSMN